MPVDTTVYMLTIRLLKAGIAQLVEHHVANVNVASSSLVSRSKFKTRPGLHQRRVFIVSELFGLTLGLDVFRM